MKNEVIVGVSNRHIHLSAADRDVLFGKEHVLNVKKELLQPGQFAAEQVVAIEGMKGTIERVRVLGPLRLQTQVEISITDAYRLGVEPCIRSSGDLKGSPGIRIHGPNGSIELNEGTIVAARHIHLDPTTAERMGIKNGQLVGIKIGGLRAMKMENVMARVSESFVPEIHIDMDEANAASIKNNDVAEVIVRQDNI